MSDDLLSIRLFVYSMPIPSCNFTLSPKFDSLGVFWEREQALWVEHALGPDRLPRRRTLARLVYKLSDMRLCLYVAWVVMNAMSLRSADVLSRT